MLKFLAGYENQILPGDPTGMQDSESIRKAFLRVAEAGAKLYSGSADTFTIQQVGNPDTGLDKPIPQNQAGTLLGCRWLGLTSEFPDFTGLELQVNDPRLREDDPRYGAVAETIMNTAWDLTQRNSKADIPRPLPDWHKLPNDKSDPDFWTRPWRTADELAMHKAIVGE